MLDVKIRFASWQIKQVDLMTEFYCGGVVVVVFVFIHGNPENILVLLRVEAMPLVSCS